MGKLNYGLEAEWKKHGYPVPMASSKLVPPPPAPFLRVYHITGADHAIGNISLHRIKVARVADLNDPFELMAVNFRNRSTRELVAKWKREYGQENGLLSFSSDWKNPVLWSHYGDKHRGMCLGFNLHRDHATAVKYEAERLSDELDHSVPVSITSRIAAKLLATKFQHWLYEGEWRRFVPLHEAVPAGSLHFFPFSATLALAEVILGERCTFDVAVVRSLTKTHYKGVNVIKARLEHKGFHIVPDEGSW